MTIMSMFLYRTKSLNINSQPNLQSEETISFHIGNNLLKAKPHFLLPVSIMLRF